MTGGRRRTASADARHDNGDYGAGGGHYRTFPSRERSTYLYPHGMSTDGQKKTNY